jgi:bacteriorhodopsin
MTSKIIKTVSQINLKDFSSLINTIGFISYGLDEYNFSKNSSLKLNEKNALKYSSTLLIVAGSHYSIINSSELNSQSEILIRYSDWFITTPLLLKVLTSYYNLSESISNKLIVFNLLMILSGLIYELTDNIKYWYLGVMNYFFLIYILYSELPELDLYFKYFILGWGLYGIVSILPKETRLLFYNILDLYNKLLFAIEIRIRISRDMKDRNKKL